MITPGVSRSLRSASAAMRAAMRAFDPPHAAERSRPGDGQLGDNPEPDQHRNFLANAVVTRHHRTLDGPQKLVRDDPDRPSRPQSP